MFVCTVHVCMIITENTVQRFILLFERPTQVLYSHIYICELNEYQVQYDWHSFV